MNTALLIYDLRRLIPWWLFSLAVLSAIFLMLPGPLRRTAEFSSVSFVSVLSGFAFGVLMSVRTFSDTESTCTFVFSRGIERTTVLRNRLILAVSAITVMSALVWALFVTGARTLVHQLMNYEDAPFYPSIAKFESNLTIEFFLTSLLTLCFCTYYQVVQGIHNPRSNSTALGIAGMCILGLPMQGLLILITIRVTDPFISDEVKWAIGLFFAVLWIAAAFRGCRHLETES